MPPHTHMHTCTHTHFLCKELRMKTVGISVRSRLCMCEFRHISSLLPLNFLHLELGMCEGAWSYPYNFVEGKSSLKDIYWTRAEDANCPAVGNARLSCPKSSWHPGCRTMTDGPWGSSPDKISPRCLFLSKAGAETLPGEGGAPNQDPGVTVHIP